MDNRPEILLVSPDEATVREIEAALDESNFNVFSVPEICDLRAILDHVRPDAAIVDMAPDPEPVAIQTLKIASVPGAPPIVALEGGALMPEDLRDRLEGYVRILRKPVFAQEVRDAIRRSLG